MSSSVEVKNTIPHKALFAENPVSTAESIRNKRQIEFRPTENNEFSPNSNSQMIFNISSSSEWLDGLDSYLSFKLKTSSETTYTNKSLNVGGAHNLIRCLEIRLQNGQLIERIDRYNRLYAIKSLSSHSRDHVEWFEHQTGDSVSGLESMDKGCGGEFITGTVAIATTGVVTGDASAFLDTELKAGDKVEVFTALGVKVLTTTVTAATAPNAAVVSPGPSAAIGAGSYIRKVSKKPARAVYADDTQHVVCLKLMSNFLMHHKFIPLKWIRQGIQIRIELERPEFVMSSNQAFDETKQPVFDYTISDPIYYGTMLTLSEAVDKFHGDKFKDKGINMEFLSYQHRLNVDQAGSAGTLKFSNNIGKRSARHIYSVIQSPWSESISRESYNYDNTSTFLKSGLQRFQYKVGSEEFPIRHVDLLDDANSRAFTELAITNGHHGGTLFDVRVCPSEWRTENYIPGIVTDTGAGKAPKKESKHLILSTRLDRDDAPWTGSNTSINPLEIEFEFGGNNNEGLFYVETTAVAAGSTPVNAGTKTRYIHSFVGYDTLFTISEKSGSVLMN